MSDSLQLFIYVHAEADFVHQLELHYMHMRMSHIFALSKQKVIMRLVNVYYIMVLKCPTQLVQRHNLYTKPLTCSC